MRLGVLSLVLALAFTDPIASIVALGYFSPVAEFVPHLIVQDVTSLTNYSFTRSPLDLVFLSLARLAIIVFACTLPSTTKSGHFLVFCNIFSIGSFSFSIVKLLALAEHQEQLSFPGVWLLFAFSITATGQHFALVHIIASGWKAKRVRSGDSDTGSTSTAELISDNGTPDDPSTMKQLWRLSAYCMGEFRWLLPALVFIVAHSSVSAQVPRFTGELLASLVDHKEKADISWYIEVITGLLVVRVVLVFLRTMCLAYSCNLVSQHIRRDLFQSLIKQDIAFFDEHKTGELMSRMTSDCSRVAEAISNNANILVRSAVTLVITVVMMFWVSWRLALVFAAVNPMMIYLGQLFGDFFDRITKEMQLKIAIANQAAEEVLSSMRTVRSLAGEQREAARFSHLIDNTLKVAWKKALGFASNNAIGEITTGGVLVAALCYGSHLIFNKQLDAKLIVTFFLYQQQLNELIQSLFSSWAGVMGSVGASRTVFTYIRRKAAFAPEGKRKDDIMGKLVLSSVSFSYPNRPSNEVLKDLSLSIAAGEKVALVGISGAGKSSIVGLVQQFYRPDDGRILLDGIPVQDFDHQYFHRKVAMVSQEPVLFNGSIMENIRYECAEATDEEVVEAAKIAHVHDFVMQMAEGYETNCGEKGTQMSGGQKQRIAIARALVRKPAVLILDEATSALDAENEAAVQKALTTCSSDRTVLLIAHRLSTIRKADRIAVLDEGRIAEVGTHDELMNLPDGIYSGLVRGQTQILTD